MSGDSFKGMENDKHLIDLQNAILHAFPDVIFDGQITRHDGEWPDEVTEETAIYEGQVMYGDEMLLYEGLKGHKWSDIPREFLYGMTNDYVLLTSEALVAFIAAWLMCSLDDLAGENLVRDLFIYTFSSNKDEQSRDFTISLLRAFNPEQLAVLRLLLGEFSESESSSFVREYARNAVKFIDSLSTGPE